MPTIGVSIAVPEPWGSRLQDFRVTNGDAEGSSIPTHITLVPPLEVPADRMPDVERHLEEVAAGTSSYRIHLRGTGTFRPVSPVVFVSLVEGISQTERLAHWLSARAPSRSTCRTPTTPTSRWLTCSTTTAWTARSRR